MAITYLTRLTRRLMYDRLFIPEGQVGSFCIRHQYYPAGTTLPIIGMREAILSGRRPADLILNHELLVHQLVEKQQGVWMTDQPCELVQMWRDLASHAQGDVLVGGLGLGILPRMIARKKSVNSITVIEESPDVISLIEPRWGNITKVFQDDIFRFAKENRQPYHCALLDTWQSDGEWTWQSKVVPLRRLLAPRIHRIYCWGEKVMQGQVRLALRRAADLDMTALKHRSLCHYYAFRNACINLRLRPWKPRISLRDEPNKAFEIMEENRRDAGLQTLVDLFLTRVGTPIWEKAFGKYWDEAWDTTLEKESQ